MKSSDTKFDFTSTIDVNAVLNSVVKANQPSAQPSSDESTISHLEAAKETLLSQGWLQGEYGAMESEEGSVCLLGALSRISRRRFLLDQVPVGYQRSYDALNLAIAARDSFRHPAYSIPGWNDTTGRTLNDVIDLLDDAIMLVKEGKV